MRSRHLARELLRIVLPPMLPTVLTWQQQTASTQHNAPATRNAARQGNNTSQAAKVAVRAPMLFAVLQSIKPLHWGDRSPRASFNTAVTGLHLDSARAHLPGPLSTPSGPKRVSHGGICYIVSVTTAVVPPLVPCTEAMRPLLCQPPHDVAPR